jgi:hypothetical protein
MDLTPAMATVLLDERTNQMNRPLVPAAVRKYKRDIMNGDWDLNGESIKISRCGLLNDGQNRCQAVVDTGAYFRTVFTFGLERDTRLSLDQGTSRTPGHRLHMEGIPNSNAVAAVAALIWQYDKYGKLHVGHDKRPTKAQISEISRNNPDIIESVRAVHGPKGTSLLGSQSILGFCHFVLARASRDEDEKSDAANAFMKSLIYGTNLEPGSPIYTCRQRLLSETTRGSQSVPKRIEIIMRAWNAFREGRTMSKSVTKKRFPKLVR